MRRKALTRRICLIFLSAVLMLAATGCYDRHEIDEMAYVMAIGLDKGKTSELKMTLQFAVPIMTGSGGGGGGGNGSGDGGSSGGQQKKPLIVTTLETPSIHSGINVVNSYVSKQLNFAHAQLVAFSEELARDGVQKYIHALMRSKMARGSMVVVVVKGNAEEYLNSTNLLLEINPSKYYKMTYDSYKYTGLTANTTLINFYLKMECYCSQAIATLAGVSKYKSTQDIIAKDGVSNEKGEENDLDYRTAGNIPQYGAPATEIMGIAIFDGDKMVGELTGKETSYYLMVTGEYKNSYISVPDPMHKGEFIILNAKERRKPAKKLEMVDGIPHADIEIDLEGDIVDIQSGMNYEEPANVRILEKAIEEYLGKEILIFLQKTAEEYHSDVCNLGQLIRTKFWLWEKWKEFNWLERYKDTKFNVKVKFKIRRSGLLLRTNPAESSEGGR
ncbi:MAG: Ger(x)C family spore germination protein [Clostridiaceae bacterium]|nr:Ger(x)C family spore germination protein [Clostridiaceae bacterium]